MPPFLADVPFGQVVALGAFIIGGIVLLKKLWPSLGRAKDFTDDWNGEVARPGHPARMGVIESIATQAEAIAAQSVQIAEIGEMVTRIEYNSKPNGGHSAHDLLMAEVKNARSDLAAHVEQAKSIHEEQAAAIAYLAEDHGALDNLAEAMPIVARSTPHDCDAPHTFPDPDEPTDDGTTGP